MTDVDLLADALIALPLLFFLGMGLLALARPDRVVDRFGIGVDTVAGRTEVRSVYGGFGLAAAGLLAWAVTTDGRGALWIPSVLAVLTFGMAVGRTLSLVLDRSRGTAVVWGFVALELALAVSLFASHTVR